MNNYYAGPELMYETNLEGLKNNKPGLDEKEIKTNEYSHMNMHHVNACMPPHDAMCATIMCQPIYECPQERVCHRVINYEVPHIMPCHTKVITHHVYKHTYTPCYTNCEENVVCDVHENTPCC